MSDEARIEKPWKCGKTEGHILGLVRRNGSGVRQLLLYRHAIDPEDYPMAEVDVMAVVEGLASDVTCEICGRVRTWVPGEEALTRLLEQVQRSRAVRA